jgi:hypothetical protein
MTESTPFIYPVRSAKPRPGLQDRWEGAAWRHVPELSIAHFRPESSCHRPCTQVKLVADDQRIYGLFRVADRFVRCVHTGFQSAVYKDSCVEFFVQPHPERGYFNFEFNCGGAVRASYITDATRTADGFKAFERLSPEEGARIAVWASLPTIVSPEITEKTTWFLAFQIPLDLLSHYVGTLDRVEGALWRANFYKCGDETSHPHWAAWHPVDALNFHLPHCFGQLRFLRVGDPLVKKPHAVEGEE